MSTPDRRTPPPERRSGEDRRVDQIWFRVDVDLLDDEAVAELGERFGADGPLAFVALLAMAKAQEKLLDQPGDVKVGWRNLKTAAFLPDHDRARDILLACAELELLAILDERALGMTVRLCAWARKQITRTGAMTSTERSQKHRAKASPNVPAGRDATPGDAAGTENVPGTTTRTSTGTDHTHTARDARPDDLAATIADVVTIGQEGIGRCRRGHLDQVGVENAIAAHPGKNARKAAHAAITRLSDPAERHTNFAKLLFWELERQHAGPPPPPRGRPARAQDPERAARRKRTGDALERLMANTTSDDDGVPRALDS